MFWNLGFGVFEKFWGFSRLLSFCWNFGMGFKDLISKSHALHHISIITVLSCILDVCNWLCAGKFGLGRAHDAISFACHMFMHFLYICSLLFDILVIFELFWSFSDCFFIPLSILFMLVMFMALKHKSTPAWNPFHSGASSFSNFAPFSLRFRDDDAHKEFLENFSRRSIHSERQVILADFADTDLPTVIHNRGWESLCDVLVTFPPVLIQECYFNMHII